MKNGPFAIIAVLTLLLQSFDAAPSPQNDIDNYGEGQPRVDYHTVMGHMKEFFMYLPVMMTTIRETMSGFPKFAEGIRVLTSRSGRLDEDCKCSKHSNEIDNNSHYR